MNKNNFLFSLIFLITGLIVGFYASNYINRNAQSAVLQNQPNAPLQNPQVQNIVVKDQPAQGGMLPDVSAVIEKAKNEPNNFEAQIKAGDMYQQIKGFDKAVAFYEQAHNVKPDNYELIVKIGNAYFDAGQFETAAKWYEQALAKNANDSDVRTDLGITFVERANPDFDRAINEFKTSLQTNPKHEPTLYNLAVAHYKKGNQEEADKILAQFESINPNSQLVGRLRQVIK